MFIFIKNLEKKHSNVLDINNNNNKCLLSSKSEYWKDWGAKEASLKKSSNKKSNKNSSNNFWLVVYIRNNWIIYINKHPPT